MLYLILASYVNTPWSGRVFIFCSPHKQLFTYHFHFTPADITTQFNPNHLSQGSRRPAQAAPSHKYSNCRHLSVVSPQPQPPSSLHCLPEPHVYQNQDLCLHPYWEKSEEIFNIYEDDYFLGNCKQDLLTLFEEQGSKTKIFRSFWPGCYPGHLQMLARCGARCGWGGGGSGLNTTHWRWGQ